MSFSPDKPYRLEELMPMLRTRLAAGETVVIGPKGTSMLPLIRQGKDFVELSPLPDRLKKYDLPLYRRQDGSFVLHRIVGVGETYTCMGDNQFRRETGVTRDQMIALVSAVYREKKRVSVTAFSYKAYCLLWHYTRFFRRAWRKLVRMIRKKS